MESVVARARRRARSPPARARASSPLLDESRIDRDTPRDRRVPPIAVGKGTSRAHTRGGDSWTGHDRWRWSFPARRSGRWAIARAG